MTQSPSMLDLAREMLALQQRLDGQPQRPGLSGELARYVGRIGTRLGRPPRVVVLGEFNTGKSTLANALIGAEMLPTSIHANTRVPLMIRYGGAVTLTYETPDRVRRPLGLQAVEELRNGTARMLHVGLPIERLKTFEVVDTPGFSTGAPAVDELILEACRRSHIAVWCTPATQAWKASEQAAWARLPARLRLRSVLAVTHQDAIRSERDRQRLMMRLGAEAAGKFGSIVLVSAPDALAAAARPGEPEAQARWTESGGRRLEQLLLGAVDSQVELRQSSARRVLQKMATRLVEPAPQSAGRLLMT